MTDYLPDSPVVGRAWCPGCEPGADASAEILDVQYCYAHPPAREGAADADVPIADVYLSGSTEAGGDSNRAWCALFHRDRQRCSVCGCDPRVRCVRCMAGRCPYCSR